MGLLKVPSPRRRRPFVGTDNDELAPSFRIDEVVETTEEVDSSSSDDKFDLLDFLWIPLRNAITARFNIFQYNINICTLYFRLSN